MQAERLAREFDVALEWRPFELHPETPPGGVSLDMARSTPHALASWHRLVTMANDLGVPLRRPPVIANSHLALEAAEFVRERAPDRFDAFHRGLFVAYFERGEDIGDIETLIAVGREAGAPVEALRKALEDRRYERAVDDATDGARAQGVTGTPTFVFDGRLPIVGAQGYDAFASVARRMGARPRGLPAG